MKSNQELAEEKYPMPNKEEYHDKALLLHPAGQAFSDLAREYIDLQIEASKQQAAFLAGIEADRWMPIETAPKDGTKIDLCLMRRDGITSRRIDCYFDADKCWVSEYGNVENKYWKVTHWMISPPLPLPPKLITTDK